MPIDTAVLLIHCPDQPGLVHAITGFIFEHGGNILDLVRLGRDVKHKVLIYHNKTVVFS